RGAIAFARQPSRGGLAVIGAIGFWAAQIGILWASFKAFGVDVPLAVVVQAFFLGMFANLIPLPGGVGGVDAGMLGAFALFGVHGIFPAVLVYRILAFWLPIPPGIVSFLHLRKTVQRWESERPQPVVAPDVGKAVPRSA
ncbi:MAG: YbhN family protein, partial [Solirubrobacterales bacterium]